MYKGNGARWVCGSSLCFTKKFWQRNRFTEINIGEDTRFVCADRTARIVVMPDNIFLVALVHGANTSPKRVHDRAWEVRDSEKIRNLMGNDWAYYIMESQSPMHRDSTDNRQTEVQQSLPPMFKVEETAKVSIGIHVTNDGAQLLASCAAIAAHTSIQTEVLLLADGADESAESAHVLQFLKHLNISANRLESVDFSNLEVPHLEVLVRLSLRRT